MKITFLGTNGWYCTQMGNTPSVLIDSNKAYVILDAGEGIHKIDRFIRDEKPILLFLSHLHIDHICGLHILNKFFFKQQLTIVGKKGIGKNLNTIINPPFTFKLDKLPYKVNMMEVDEGSHKNPIEFECKLLPHPDPSMGYRLKLEDKTITYCTDTGPHDNIIDLARAADIFISECAHLPGESSEKWPHMNPEDAAKAALTAKAKSLILMHFDAARYDTIEKRKNAETIAKKIFPNTLAAYDDMVVEL